MKRKTLFGVIVLFSVLTMSLLVYAQTSNLNERIAQEGISLWKEVIIGYETVYKDVTLQVVCGPENATDCSEYEYTEKVVDDSTQGAPIYRREKYPYAYDIDGKVILRHQENIGCFICPSDHSKQVCYSYNDGFADNLDPKWKCECKSGTSCKVLNPGTGKVSFIRTDGDII